MVRALQAISVGHQVGALALTIWTAITFKRQLRNKLSDSPGAIVDKMFVPASMGDLLNQLCKRVRVSPSAGLSSTWR